MKKFLTVAITDMPTMSQQLQKKLSENPSGPGELDLLSSRDVSLEVAKNFLNPGGVSLEVAKNFLNPGLQSGFEKLELLVKDELGITFNMDVPHRSHQIFEGAVTNPHFLKLEGNVSCSYGRAIGQ
ncbi:hypothetical protein MRB53_030828 [Persea americana]|uniref:Uncharacterized protein n=1 Tax=Persea americana TaxID=3435 RepID=A0ACC2KMC8_PERAE|nr:hypothetical protein MRB53_030828 [Persea americana]